MTKSAQMEYVKHSLEQLYLQKDICSRKGFSAVRRNFSVLIGIASSCGSVKRQTRKGTSNPAFNGLKRGWVVDVTAIQDCTVTQCCAEL